MKHFQINEIDLATLESELPAILDNVYPSCNDPVTSTALAGVVALMGTGFSGAVIYEITHWIIKTWKSLP